MSSSKNKRDWGLSEDPNEPDPMPANRKQNISNRSPESKIPKDAFCERPFVNFRTRTYRIDKAIDGLVVETCCSAWHQKALGHLKDNKTMNEVFNSERAKAFRRSILDGSFKFCNKNICPKITMAGKHDKAWQWRSKDQITNPHLRNIIDNNIVDGLAPRRLSFDWDVSCNLKCPSCRDGLIKYRKGTGPYNKLKKIQDEAVKFCLDNATYDDKIQFNITGTGDAIGSTLYREFLQEFDGRPWKKLEITLMTNGVMLTEKIWNSMFKVHNNITRIEISIDAGNKECYDKVRVGGNWDQLIKNLEFLSDINAKREKPFEFWLKIVVQKNNFTSLPELVALGDRLDGVTRVMTARVFNWGRWSPEEFKNETAVWRDDNPYYKELQELYKGDWTKSPKFYDKVNFDLE
jgi:sulfatase maturation enzyme AslB (radical SAM superfamily)